MIMKLCDKGENEPKLLQQIARYLHHKLCVNLMRLELFPPVISRYLFKYLYKQK